MELLLNQFFKLGCLLTHRFPQHPASEMPFNNCLFTKNNRPFMTRKIFGL